MAFIELPAFSKRREEHLTGQEYQLLLTTIKDDPTAGRVMRGMAGLRKMRFRDVQHSKGTRGGLRIVYLYVANENIRFLYFVYRKSYKVDLNSQEREFFESSLNKK